MLDRRRWRFGKFEIVILDFAFLASELDRIKRIESFNRFTYFLKQWIGKPAHRRSLIDIERQVTSARRAPQLGRSSGRESDATLVAGLQSAFQARKLHLIEIVGSLLPGPLTAGGKSWEFDEARIVQGDSALSARELADFFWITDAANFSRHTDKWLKEPVSRRILQNIHETIKPSSKAEDRLRAKAIVDKHIADDLLTAWKEGKLYLLRRRVTGGSGDEEEFLAATAQQLGNKYPSQAKTWIEIVLKDQDNQPMAGVRYRL
jgi:hypothetical protein